MKLELRAVTTLDEALTFAAHLDACAAEFMAQFSDEPFPIGASERSLRRDFAERESVVVVAEGEPRRTTYAVCWTGPLVDPLLGTKEALVLVLHVDSALRHRGVASELVGEVERVLATRGVRRLAARAAHNDDALISMGERWGFVRSWELMVKE